MHFPPPAVRHVTGIDILIDYIPIAIVISVAEPRLPAQIVYGVDFRRVSPEKPILDSGLHGAIGPEVLKEVDPPGKTVPPHEHLVEEALVAAVVGNHVFAVAHENPEGALGGLDDHYAGVEDREVVAGGRHLREVEEEVEAAKNDDVGVDENDLVVLGQLPEPELAVVVLVVRPLLRPRVSNAIDHPDLPPGTCQGLAFGSRDGLIQEQDKVALCACLAEALGQRYGAANVRFGGVEHSGVGFSFDCLRRALDSG